MSNAARVQDDMRNISAVAAEQRAVNARYTTLGLTVLTALSVPATAVIGGELPVLLVLGGAALGLGVAHVLVLRGSVIGGVLLTVVSLLGEHVGSVAANGGILGPVPYISALVLLFVAATATSRWLWPALLLSLTALVAEAALSPWQADDQGAIFTAGLFAAISFVISFLHVRGTERAFAEAERRERARAEAMVAARESERLYRLIAEHTDDLISLVTSSGTALYLSPSHERMLGLDPRAVLGQPMRAFLQVENLEEVASAFASALADGEAHVEMHVRLESGKVCQLDTRFTRVEADNEVMVATIGRDVTATRQLQDRLVASERLEALGRLAGSVAHDFNNLLMVIVGGTELAQELIPAEHPAGAELSAVQGAVSAAGRLTAQLLTFSRRQLTIPDELDLKESLLEQRELLQRMVGSKVQLAFELPESLPEVHMPSSHFEQLAMNLSVNARDAMPAGGKLTYRLEQVQLEEGQFGVVRAGEHVVFSVTDDGVGIDEGDMTHLFEPAFTTKRTGTGLGLATCHGIVSQLGGGVEVQSQLGHGSTFRFFLPIREQPKRLSVMADAAAPVTHVLVVDDERAVRETTARILTGYGFQVRAVATLRQAQEAIEDVNAPLDALVTDIVLGKDRGTDLLEAFRHRHPQGPIVVISGFSPEPGLATVVKAQRATFLPKPFRRGQLLAALGGSAAQGATTNG